jgi:demethylmenaquinone methyltransferase/2-methoxy-6-polyprenyl-1,4-benzoquinol methylase
MTATHDAPSPGAGETLTYAQVLERMNRFQEAETRAAIADLRLPAGSHGLDVGCGVGLYALWLAEAIGPGGQVIGIDRAAESIAAAQQLVGTRLGAGRLEFRQGDGTAIAAAAHAFDWVWCADVLHHIDNTALALQEFRRVVRPGGQIIIKESQVLQALFLPGYIDLERQLQRAEMQFNRAEAGARSFQERRQRTCESMLEAGLCTVNIRTYVVQRQAPLDAVSRAYIQQVVFERNWGPRLRGLVDARDWEQRTALCEATSPQAMLQRPDYYCIYPFTVFTARLPR